MKRYLFVSVIAAMALASCSSDDFLGDGTGNNPSAVKLKEISFGGETGKITRADDAKASTDKTGSEAAAALGNNFIVYGEKTKDGKTSTVYNYYNVNWKTAGDNTTEATWVYADETKNSLNTTGTNLQTIKYWDYGATSYDFTAFSLGNGTNITVTRKEDATSGIPTYTLTGKVSDLQNCYFADRKIVKNDENNKEFGKHVQFTFRTTGTKVGMGIYEDIPGYSIKEIRFYDSDESHNAMIRPVLYANNNCIPVNDATGTLTVTFDNDNKANPVLTKDAEGETTDVSSLMLGTSFNLIADKEGNETNNDQDKFLGRKRATATSTGEKVVSPRKITGGLTLKVDYTLISTDGSGEEITVKGATAKIDEKYTDWKSNYVYTYIFKITKDTNGSTGGTSTGLSPIVFDALVTEDIAGSQTTETTFDTNGEGTTKDITNEPQETE